MKKDRITISEYCSIYHIDSDFINSLQEYELIEISFVNNEGYIRQEQLHLLERYTRLYQELNINPEGIEAVSRLLDKIDRMEQEIRTLKNQVKFFEQNN